MSTPSLPRSSGILLHPTSLPGPFGIGDLGPVAYRWIETLAAMKQTWWQILPLGPTGAGDSPYQSFSAFAGNINLLSPELLQEDGLVSGELWANERFSNDQVEYDRVLPFKQKVLRAAWDAFRSGKAQGLRHDFDNYCTAEAGWLNDYALFMAIREALGGKGLVEWPPELLQRKPAALEAKAKELADEVRMHKFGQFLFDRQWTSLRKFAAERKVKIIGDAPIFIAHDSADLWANPGEFLLDAHGKSTVMAGVPPDYFSEDGQLWGNPIYDWAKMEATGFAWWCARVGQQLKQVDLLRLDHFRGFAQAWHIPTGEKTARNGKWVDGPGAKLFERLRAILGSLPIIAEDLGLITPDVHELRDAFGLPGMRVIEFAVDSPTNPHWPHNYVPNCVAYTGTHDNDTVKGWYATLNDRDRTNVAKTLGKPVSDPAWDLIWLAWSSVAAVAISPLQDVLSMGSEARMNRPGVANGNWRWRLRLDQFRQDAIPRLAELTTVYNRIPPEDRLEK